MRNLRLAVICVMVAVVLLVSACQQPQPSAPVGMPNPSSVYCAGLGYQQETRTDANGEYGVCLFPDGTECEEWSFFRGECGLDKTYCAQQGNTPEVRDGVLTCVFADGSSCPEYEYFQGTCKPGQ